MKSAEMKSKYIHLRATGTERIDIARELGISVETGKLWEKVYKNRLIEARYEWYIGLYRALKDKHTGANTDFNFDEDMLLREILTAIGNLLNRIRNGECNNEQASRESVALTDILYELIVVRDDKGQPVENEDDAYKLALMKKRAKVRGQLKTILDIWKESGLIDGYTENLKNPEKYGVTIRLDHN